MENSNDATKLLIQAVNDGDYSGVQQALLLLQKEEGFNINNVHQDKYGRSPLRMACDSRYFEIAKLLVTTGGADLNAKQQAIYNTEGETLLHRSSFNGNLEVVQFLLEHGANASATNSSGGTPLHYVCCIAGYLAVKRLLIEKGANINARDNYGRTALHIACMSHFHLLDTIRLLVEHGADLNIKDNLCGSTPLHKTCDKGFLVNAKLLIENGADLNVVDSDGRTPLYKACEDGYLKVVQFLLSRGANVNTTKTTRGGGSTSTTPLQIASERKKLEVVWLLVRQYPLVVLSERLE